VISQDVGEKSESFDSRLNVELDMLMTEPFSSTIAVTVK
jgi:hypothetical protein